jgi:hypothetical protein
MAVPIMSLEAAATLLEEQNN